MRRTVGLAAVVLALAAPSAWAEERTVVLTNGGRITGEIESDGKVIVIRTANGRVRIPRNLVHRIEKAAPPPGKTSPAATPAAPPGPARKTAVPEKKPAPKAAAPASVAVVASHAALLKRFDEVAALADGPERTLAQAQLGAEASPEAICELLAESNVAPPLPPGLALAVATLQENGPVGRVAALKTLRGQSEVFAPLFAALERFWNDDVEGALLERLTYPECRDHAQAILILGQRAGRRAIPPLVDVLFYSDEKLGLTWPAQIAISQIARRDESPDEALNPLISRLRPGWPGHEQEIRRRDVILAVGSSLGAGVPWLAKMAETIEREDVEGRGSCWKALCRIGTNDATAAVLRAFQEPKLADAKLEVRRLYLLAEAIGEATLAAKRPDFLSAVANGCEGFRADLRVAFLAALEKLTHQSFKGDVGNVRRYVSDLMAGKASPEEQPATPDPSEPPEKQSEPEEKPSEPPMEPEAPKAPEDAAKSE